MRPSVNSMKIVLFSVHALTASGSVRVSYLGLMVFMILAAWQWRDSQRVWTMIGGSID